MPLSTVHIKGHSIVACVVFAEFESSVSNNEEISG